MRKLTPFDAIERAFMDATPEEFALLEERVATIKRLRKLDKKPKPAKPDEIQLSLREAAK